MGKVLGLDLGTNSIGWAIIEQGDSDYRLLDKGVNIFQEGVARDKGSEKPAVQDRTNFRALRRHYFRRRLRKIELLRILIANDFCPKLTEEQLSNWKEKKMYPITEGFIQWQRTDDNAEKNPYHDRFLCLTTNLDLSQQKDRYILGRALYHLSQRRGFLSNRKDQSNNEDGKVKSSIKELTLEMECCGCKYLGEYFYHIYNNREKKIRNNYASRTEHYVKEFDAICEKQSLSDSLRRALYRAIFFQRPLKSQKGLVGKCTFEKNKSRCPVSHPRFEEFRMLSFVNNIKIKTPSDLGYREINEEEFNKIKPLFFRKNKAYFDFEEIAKKIAGKGQYACKGDNIEAGNRFNYSAKTTVSGCQFTASLIGIFGDDWLVNICERYTLGSNKTAEQILNDIWHVLFSFDNDENIISWAKEKLQLSDEEAKKFAVIRMPQGYASLSLNAINKILPYLRQGYRYDDAVFLANLKSVLPHAVISDQKKFDRVISDITNLLTDFSLNPLNKSITKEQAITDHLRNYMDINDAHLDRLYHPSMIETYQQVRPNSEGLLQLGSPRTQSIRNPMAMRALFKLRILVNHLLKEKKIDTNTKVNIEFSRGLNDANQRKAIERYQSEREKENKKYAQEIAELYATANGGDTLQPTQDDILKYRLWEEQQHICLYTGKEISINDFIGSSTSFDIEHTIPRSRGGDNSQMNKTLCENSFNRKTKGAKIPFELSNHSEILARIETLRWKENIKSLQEQIESQKRKSKTAVDKSNRDAAIEQRHYLKLKLDYWLGKYRNFILEEIPEGFSNRQGVDIGIIGKYARLYLKTVFDKVYTVKGATTAEFRKIWGLQDEYGKKERTNHCHHCIDAITIACIGKKEYDRWAQYMLDEDRYDFGYSSYKPEFDKPWPTFTEDVKNISNEILISHSTPDNMPKQSRKKLRIRGKIRFNKENKPIYIQGDTARGSLHQQTFYGAIKRDDEIKHVVRKALNQLQQSDVDKIVDDVVREKVKEAVESVGFKKAVDSTKHQIWMNEEKKIPINKVRIYVPSVTQPIHLKKQRDLSNKNYKQDYHVANESNYCMAIYEGTDVKGKIKRTFAVVSNLEAANYFKTKNKEKNPYLVPLSDSNEYPLKCLLKVGTMVLLYEKSSNEIYECTSKDEITKRLYKVIGFSKMSIKQGAKQYTYGVISLRHNQEARPSIELKSKNGIWKIGEEIRPMITLLHAQFNALVEGVDFDLSVTGEVKFKHK